jgi:hypothetical protein
MCGELQAGQYGNARSRAELILRSAQQPNVTRGMGGFRRAGRCGGVPARNNGGTSENVPS